MVLAGTRVLAIIGPTAVGKSAVALGLAERLAAEIVSADSMQVYRGMNIGTAKPSPEERERVRHHLIDVVSASDDFSVARYAELSRHAIKGITDRQSLPLVVGGSGLYVRAALDQLDFPAGRLESPVRRRFERLLEQGGAEELFAELKQRDPLAADRIHPNNARRMIRALEVIETTGKRFSEFTRDWERHESVYDLELFGLTMDRGELVTRIDARIERQLDAGLLAEVGALVEDGRGPSVTARQALGYRELAGYLAGEQSFEEAVALFKQRTRSFARRQLTWFRRDPRVHWMDASGVGTGELVDSIEQRLREKGFLQ